jgi:hypothetical protein
MPSAQNAATYGVIMNEEEREVSVPQVDSILPVNVDDGGEAGPDRKGMATEEEIGPEDDKPDTLMKSCNPDQRMP